jgi:hypothetical protein
MELPWPDTTTAPPSLATTLDSAHHFRHASGIAPPGRDNPVNYSRPHPREAAQFTRGSYLSRDICALKILAVLRQRRIASNIKSQTTSAAGRRAHDESSPANCKGTPDPARPSRRSGHNPVRNSRRCCMARVGESRIVRDSGEYRQAAKMRQRSRLPGRFKRPRLSVCPAARLRGFSFSHCRGEAQNDRAASPSGIFRDTRRPGSSRPICRRARATSGSR